MTSISSKNKKLNISIVKLLFVLCIVIMHYQVPWQIDKPFMVGGYIYVEFFFILQGFYIENFLRHYDKEMVVQNYVVTRIKKFFPIVAFQAVVLLCIEWLFFCETKVDYALKVVGTLYQLSFISIIPYKIIMNNGTLWFLSAYIIAGGMLLAVIKNNALNRGGHCFLAA